MKAGQFVSPEQKRYLVQLPIELVEAARAKAAAQGGSFCGLLRALLRAYVDGSIDVIAEGRPRGERSYYITPPADDDGAPSAERGGR